MRPSLMTLLPAIASRPALLHARCFAAHAKPAGEQQLQHEANLVQNVHDQPINAAVVPPAFGIHRVPSIFAEMQREMDALTRSFGMPRLWPDTDNFMQPFQSPIWTELSKRSSRELPIMRLATDVEEDDKSYTIKADVPGIGERNEETREEGDKDKPARYERRFGSFSRSFTLPKNVDVEGISANAKDGVLTVTIPKMEEEKPKAKDIPVA
eukprot:gene5750-5990_t